MTTVTTTVEIAGWDEQTTTELAGEGRLARADVTLGAGPDGLGPGTFSSQLYYRSDGTSSYVLVMHLSATLEGRSGGFVLIGPGTFDGTTAASEMTVVEGSGTGELAGISGRATSASRQADYPNMPLTLTYDLE